MTKRKKQQGITILVMCVLLVAAGIAYLCASRWKTAKEEAESDTDIALYEVEEDALAAFSYSNDTAEISLVKEDDTWQLSEDADFPVEQSTVDSMVSEVLSMSATRLVTEECDDLSEYGLDEPQLVLTLTDTDGTEYKITYGMESAAASGCYAYLDEDTEVVYVVSSSTTSSFNYTKNQLMELPEEPEIEEDEITFYSVETAKGRYFAAEAIETEDDSSSEEDSSSDDSSSEDEEEEDAWNITKSWGKGKVTSYDQDQMDVIITYLADLSLEEGVSYSATAKEKKKYGLDTPTETIYVAYDVVETDEDTEEETVTSCTFTLCIGNMDDTGYYYYVTYGDDNGIYLMDSDTVETLIDVVL